MKVKCPYCRRLLKIPYDKIKQRILQEIPSYRVVWIAGIIIAVGISGTLGFFGSKILTRSKERKAQNQISQLQEEAEKLIRAKQIPSRSTSSRRLGQRDMSTGTALQPSESRSPVPQNHRPGFQPVPVPNSKSVNLQSETSTQSVFQNPTLITFLPGKRVSVILINDGSNSWGLPKSKMIKARQGFYFYVVESRVNTLAWPKEKTEFGGQDWVNIIKSTSIVLETTDGKRMHPSFASFGMSDFRTKETVFIPGSFRYVALVFRQSTARGKPSRIMYIYMARPGPQENLFTVKEEGGVIDPDRSAFRIDFAFSIPIGSRVKTVGLSKIRSAATDGSRMRSGSQTPGANNTEVESTIKQSEQSTLKAEQPIIPEWPFSAPIPEGFELVGNTTHEGHEVLFLEGKKYESLTETVIVVRIYASLGEKLRIGQILGAIWAAEYATGLPLGASELACGANIVAGTEQPALYVALGGKGTIPAPTHPFVRIQTTNRTGGKHAPRIITCGEGQGMSAIGMSNIFQKQDGGIILGGVSLGDEEHFDSILEVLGDLYEAIIGKGDTRRPGLSLAVVGVDY